ncbi:hypothetical protein ACFXDH_52460 [Streptomyces sp. NPDC059467]|uniref:hypothetical protein n=1 Tax=Streptomyces sp. NPDC059467 TaxID=3346844 RepID=UPI00368AD9CF
MSQTTLRRPANGEPVEEIHPDLINPTGERKGQNPSVAGIYRVLAEHARCEVCRVTAEQANANLTALRADELPVPRTATTGPALNPRKPPMGCCSLVSGWGSAGPAGT